MTDKIWTDKMVMAYLEEAADIHRRLPPVTVQGYFNLWPETLKDDWTRLNVFNSVAPSRIQIKKTTQKIAEVVLLCSQ